MKLGAWIVTLPIAAIGAAWGIVLGGSWASEYLPEVFPNEERKTALAIDVAFNKVISEADWAAAGFSTEESSFDRFLFPKDSQRFHSGRTLGRKRGMQGFLTLSIEPVEDVVPQRRAFLERVYEESINLGSGFAGGGNDPDRSWYVFAERRNESDLYEELRGRCFHDGVTVVVSIRRDATPAQAEGFKRMIEGASARLAAVCNGDLKPYVDQVATQHRLRPR